MGREARGCRTEARGFAEALGAGCGPRSDCFQGPWSREVRSGEAIARQVPDYVTVRPRGSVLILTDFADASFDKEALRTMKESAVFDKPFVKKSALIGTETLPRQLYEDITRI
jgi:hypothetical protein